MVNLRYLSKISNFQLVRTSSYLTSRLTFQTHPSANATQKISRYSSSVLLIVYQFPPEYFRSHLKKHLQKHKSPVISSLVSGIPTPRKNMSSSVGVPIPNIWET